VHAGRMTSSEPHQSALSAPRTCPGCGHEVLVAVHDGELTNFACLACGQCWHVELAYARRVSPHTCPGCSLVEWCRARTA
jgi:ribosomal protein S27AE